MYVFTVTSHGNMLFSFSLLHRMQWHVSLAHADRVRKSHYSQSQSAGSVSCLACLAEILSWITQPWRHSVVYLRGKYFYCLWPIRGI